ncbi:PKHD1 like 1, tandem duplicate 1 [Brachionichthys hirsutus]|uniref:PKHD1 like 1, tandem duplicate 1 n=1 Tax=Brachionichthys hirsutus TaxID=412623 RepID=UPI003604CF54
MVMRAATVQLVMILSSGAGRVDFIFPRMGSYNGATKITIFGAGFSQKQQFLPNQTNQNDGNQVSFVSDFLSVPCDVERDSTHGTLFHCYTRAMPRGQYVVKVSVDGVPFPDSSICRGRIKGYHCSFYTVWYRTPTIRELSPSSGPPGSLLTLRGRLFTDVYGIHHGIKSNKRDVKILRVYAAGMPCELLKPDSDELYLLKLDSENSNSGHMSCKMTGTYVGHQNISYILDKDYGRSLPDKKIYKVSGSNRLHMFQTYAEVTGVSPSKGSLMGGTLLTVHGRFLDDQTHQSPRVLVGGGRGMKMEIWNNTQPSNLEEIFNYNENTVGYWQQWIGSLPGNHPEMDFSTSRSRGFFVPAVSANYTIYYMEVLFQGSSRHYANFSISLFKEESSFTEDQTDDAVNEVQKIIAKYDVFNEEQVLKFRSWPSNAMAVNEVQRVTVRSNCSSHLCGSTYFRLIQQTAHTGMIPVGASAEVVEGALNQLWSIKPDTVQVTKQDDGKESHYTITFISGRGDFSPLGYEVFGTDLSITITEVTKGRSNMETFTLRWEGVTTKPIPVNANESEVQSVLEAFLQAECPSEILPEEGSDVKYFNDFENKNSQFKGNTGTLVKNACCGQWSLKNAEVLFKETFRKVSGGTWSYKCMDLQSSLQTFFVGSKYRLLEFYLYKYENKDFYVDAAYFGKNPTTGDENGSQSELSCVVAVINPLDTVNMPNGYTYKTQLTPVITDVSPRRGGTAGGTRLTIRGYGFSTEMNEVNVTIAGSVCDVQSSNAAHIICLTNSQQHSQETKVRVSIRDLGKAKQESADFFYIDVWSSRFTWGGLPPPEKGSFAVITKGQTILLDISTPVLKMLLIQGGTLIFDEADIELQAENILITDGGHLQIGTEEAPFQHKAVITLHGHVRSVELPVYGAKTLAVREGVLDLHGVPVPVPWTHLSQTAPQGSSTLTLMKSVTWKAGDEIVIASTGDRHSQRENEKRTIAAVSSDGNTITLTEPLAYTHLGVTVTLPDGTNFGGRAEVGLLTRNIVVQGSQKQEWKDKIDACPNGFNTGQFATQTCFQGRFGEEIGADQFGCCIMLHAPRANENLAVGRIEYVEVFHAGQASRLGRYPIHWHRLGDINYKSYVRGCAIHETFNRAVNIHDTHKLLVEFNVIHNIMGGAFFLEDGIETQNIIQYNLAVSVKQSTSLLNDDITPAAYWVTNPNNIIRHNAAAGGTHFGFWYRMHEHPEGASFDRNICLKMIPLGEFYNNTVHSQGWFGLWIFEDYFPMKDGVCHSKSPEPAVFSFLTTWNCEKGAEWVNVGAVQFKQFVMLNNEKAGIEAKRLIPSAVTGFGLDAGAIVFDSIIVSHVDELGLGEEHCTSQGVIVPLDDGLSVLNTTFINFNRQKCSAIGFTSIDGICTDRCGGWSSRYGQLKFFNSQNKVFFRWEHEAWLLDIDGSLTGKPDHKVVPMSSLLDRAHCSPSPEFSVGFPAAVCDHTVNLHRLALNKPTPSALEWKDVVITNEHGSSVISYLDKRLTHRFGWMSLLPSKTSYNLYFKNSGHITNITYNAKCYGFKPDEYVIISHNFTQSVDRVHIIDDRNGSSAQLTFSNSNGDWYFNKTSNVLSYIVSGRTSQRLRRDSVDRSLVDTQVNFKVYRCFFPSCIEPPPAALTPPFANQPDNFTLWSNASFWKTLAENNFNVPTEGADLIIPSNVWVVLDVSTPPLNKLIVMGVLEISDPTSGPVSSVVIDAVYISIQGGRLLAGRADEPFRGQLLISLRGSHSTPDWLQPNGPNQGSKVLGVFGTLELYGQPHNVYHAKLAATAPARSNTLTLAKSVDWTVGDEVVVSTTSYNAWETEKRQITDVSGDGRILTLNLPLAHTHIGETHSVPGTVFTYTLAADVGLLTRNIKVIGQEYPKMMTESFGARLLVGTYSWAGINHKGKAQLRNVEFFHSGQEGWKDDADPRYSVVFLNLGEVSGEDSYIQGCAFHDGFSPAIGVIGTDQLKIDDNVIHHTVGQGIRVKGNGIIVRRNLVSMTLWPGSYQGREEPQNLDWVAGIEVSEAITVVLQHNIIAGYERVAYHIDGEQCPGSTNKNEKWTDNEAHGGLFGVYMNKDGLPLCSLIEGFFIWRSFDHGIYLQTSMNVIVSNVTLVDNGLGIMSLIYGPPSPSHLFAEKNVQIQDALIVGSSPNFNCLHTLPSTDFNTFITQSHRAPRPPNGGRAGICWPNFQSTQNNAPKKSHHMNNNYNAIGGQMLLKDTTFVHFRDVCSGERNVMFITNPLNEDLQHAVQVSGITMIDSKADDMVFIHRPDLRTVNPSDCVDMNCDAKKKALIRDVDGSLLGSVGAVVPHSEYEWGGDPRRGLGDYRIPKVMLSFPNGSRIPVDSVAPYKGVIRKNCTYVTAWQAYKCFGLNYRMLVIESLDSDTETRRLSPVAVHGEGFVDLINGPQDHGWCSGYTCRRRLSLFHAIVATGHNYDIFFSSTSPQNLRLMMLNAEPSETIVASVFYSKPQRMEVYVDSNLVAPSNAEWNADKSDYALKKPFYTGQYFPKLNGTLGNNYFDPDKKMVMVLLRGSEPAEVRTSPMIFVSFDLPAMTEEEFFGEALVNNLAAFLKVPPDMIRITNIIREDGGARRKRSSEGGLTVKLEIRKTVQQTESSTNEETFTDMRNIADRLGQAAILGSLTEATGYNVSSLSMIKPPPHSSESSWLEEASENVTREEPGMSFVSSMASLMLMVEPNARGVVGPLYQQPKLMAVDERGQCVSVGVTTLTVTASLQDSEGNSIDALGGNTTILFSGCWANFTDISVDRSGESLTMTFTLKEWRATSGSFSIRNTATASNTAPPTYSTIPTKTTADSGIPAAGAAVSAGSLCVISIIYSIGCSDMIPSF